MPGKGLDIGVLSCRDVGQVLKLQQEARCRVLEADPAFKKLADRRAVDQRALGDRRLGVS